MYWTFYSATYDESSAIFYANQHQSPDGNEGSPTKTI